MTLLTTKNLKIGLWINDPKYGLSKIVHVHKSVAMHIDETPFTYKIYKGHYCYTSTSETGENYKITVLPFYHVWWLQLVRNAKDCYRRW